MAAPHMLGLLQSWPGPFERGKVAAAPHDVNPSVETHVAQPSCSV
jgi:hypothetical protein